MSLQGREAFDLPLFPSKWKRHLSCLEHERHERACYSVIFSFDTNGQIMSFLLCLLISHPSSCQWIKSRVCQEKSRCELRVTLFSSTFLSSIDFVEWQDWESRRERERVQETHFSDVWGKSCQIISSLKQIQSFPTFWYLFSCVLLSLYLLPQPSSVPSKAEAREVETAVVSLSLREKKIYCSSRWRSRRQKAKRESCLHSLPFTTKQRNQDPFSWETRL